MWDVVRVLVFHSKKCNSKTVRGFSNILILFIFKFKGFLKGKNRIKFTRKFDFVSDRPLSKFTVC